MPIDIKNKKKEAAAAKLPSIDRKPAGFLQAEETRQANQPASSPVAAADQSPGPRVAAHASHGSHGQW